jgi:hypothetical protein
VALTAFFVFGASVSLLTCLAVLFPGSPLEPLWRLKPEARSDFQTMGSWASVLLIPVSAACAMAARGLWTRRRWGLRLAIGVLATNLVGDVANMLLRGDPRTLIGLPIGGAMITYLLSTRVRGHFPAAGAG